MKRATKQKSYIQYKKHFTLLCAKTGCTRREPASKLAFCSLTLLFDL